MSSAMRAWITFTFATLRAAFRGSRARRLRHAGHCGLAAID
jgi:hypothetical protein